MSVVDLKKYAEMCQTDTKVRERAKAIGIADVTKQISYAGELGLKFSMDDIKALADEAGVSKGELSEDQLEQIAGGCATLTMAMLGIAAGLGLGLAAGGVAAGAVTKIW